MANEQNLRPSEYKLSQEEAKRGGIASGEARRKKKSMREAAESIMSLRAPEELLKRMRSQGVPVDDDRYVHAVVFAQVARALKGDSRSAYMLMELLGEKVDKIELSTDDRSALEMEAYFANKKRGA